MEIEKSEEFGQSLPSPPSTPDSENWKERVRERTKERFHFIKIFVRVNSYNL
jgi:hypothetical protein